MANKTSVQSGNWSNTATWGGSIPISSSNVIIATGHTVTIDVNSTVDGVVVNTGATLKYAPSANVTLISTKNVEIYGKLEAKPTSASFTHTLRFTGITETNFVGGGMSVLASDVGLWVMGGVMGELTGGGELDILGTQKTSWANASGSITAGNTTIALDIAPIGWAVGDEIVITPTQDRNSPSFINGFEERTITNILGNIITLNAGVSLAHPKVNGLWGAEVVNLSRNVKIEGTSSGRSHIFIRSNGTQSIKYAQIRYMGPRKDINSDGITELVLGRYGIHFHHCMDGSIGSIVEGCTIRDGGNHSYVPHVSNGITFYKNSAFNVFETAFWWDEADASHEILYDSNIVVNCKFSPRSLAVDTGDPETPNLAVSGFLIGIGDGCIARNNVVTACHTGDLGSGGGYFWQANNEGVWKFDGNTSHNVIDGIFVWQNSNKNHVIENQITYNCYNACYHGAYSNSYTYRGGHIYGCTFRIEASSGDSNRVRVENITFNGGGIADYCLLIFSSPIPAPFPTFVRNCTFTGYLIAAITDQASTEVKNVDVVMCVNNGGGTLAMVDSNALSTEAIRVQPVSGTPTRITKAGTTTISAFAPTQWGTGLGLQGEYFNNSTLSGSPVVVRLDSVIAFQEWSTGIHHKITGDAHSMRWTGEIEAQYTQSTTFITYCAGGVRLWINNTLVIDEWADSSNTTYTSSPVSLTSGTKYTVRLDYFSEEAPTGILFFWRSTSIQGLEGEGEFIPETQLYAPVVGPINQPPVANAGVDKNITLPTNSTTLVGTGSSDDVGIVSYLWTRISGPNTPTLANSNTATVTVSGLIAGTYTYRLTVTDIDGLNSTDDVIITVSNSNTPPTSRAGVDQIIRLPINEVILDGTASTDGDGTITSYLWSKVGGPLTYTLMDETSATAMAHDLVQGDYIFRLLVTDNNGATSIDDMIVTVQPSLAANIPPTVTVGSTVLVILPTTVATITGTSSDSDGTIIANKWTRISGPNTPTITNSNALTTTVTGLVAGVYVFRLTATDNRGGTSSKDQTVVVSPSTGVTIQGRYNIIIQ